MNRTLLIRLLKIPLLVGLCVCTVAILLHPAHSKAKVVKAKLPQAESATSDEDLNQPPAEETIQPSVDFVVEETVEVAITEDTPDSDPATPRPEETVEVEAEREEAIETVVSEPIEPKPIQTSPAQPENEIQVTNRSARYPVAFLLNNEIRQLAPGESLRVEDAAAIHFDRGADFGPSFQELEPGQFEFKLTSKGWQLGPVQD